MKTNLESIGAKVIADDFPVTAILNHKSYKIDANGKVEMQENADRAGINVGDYINFEPDTDYDEEGNQVAKKYSKDYLALEYTGNQYSGSSDIEQRSLKWQVLKIYEDGSMKLMGSTGGSIAGGGSAKAYNNVVWLLNDICEQLYSKKSVQITARSVNLEDFEDEDFYVNKNKGIWKTSRDKYINEQMLARKSELDNESEYIQNVDVTNNTVTYKKDISYYPNLYAEENGSGIDKNTIKTNGIKRSDNFFYNRDEILAFGKCRISDYKHASNYLTTQFTSYENEINELNYGDAYNVLKTEIYVLASRVVKCSSNCAEFGLPLISNGSLGFRKIMTSKKGYRLQGIGFRPIVTLRPNVKITPSETASSEDGIPHEITAYK